MSTMEHTQHTSPPPFQRRLDLEREHEAAARKMGMPQDAFADLRIGTMGQCRIICAREQVSKNEPRRWHLSISHPWRLPTWDEINAARDALVPANVFLCQPIPPKALWINVHAHTLHCWEIRDRELLVQWAFDGCQQEALAEMIVDEFLMSRED